MIQAAVTTVIGYAIGVFTTNRDRKDRCAILESRNAELYRALDVARSDLSKYQEKYHQHRQLAIDEGIRAINAENALAQLKERYNIRQSPPTPAAPTFTPSDSRD